MYIYKSPIGTFKIKEYYGRWQLWFEEEVYGEYESAVAAANNVYLHVTGCDEWDELDGQISDEPTDIAKWESM